MGAHTEVVHRLVRRGIDAMSSESGEPIVVKASALEMAPIIISCIFFAFLLASVRYTLGGVVASLAMIEQPQTTVFESSTIALGDNKDDKDDSDKARLLDEEVIVINQVPITSSIRKTIRHLHSIGGFRARWRGAGSALIYSLAQSFVVNFITMLTGFTPLFRVIAVIISNVLCAQLHMAWTHTVISEPSGKSWRQRIPKDKKVWRALVLPSLVHSVAEMATYGLPAAMFAFVGPNINGPNSAQHLAIRGVISLVACIMLNVLILLPATVTLTRVEASFLPEDENTIVPFDRTFNGAINMISLDSRAGRKSLFVEAWRSFDMPSRIRLVKFFIKEAAVETFISVTATICIATQVYAIGYAKFDPSANMNGM